MNSAKFVKDNDIIEKIASNAKNILDEEHNMYLPSPKAVATVAYVFLKEICKEIENADSINVLEIITLDKGEDGDILLNPGQEMKLLIKDDK